MTDDRYLAVPREIWLPACNVAVEFWQRAGMATMPTTQTTAIATDAWWLYVLLCANERLYVGIAKDVDARFRAHCSGKGAIFTRLNAPVRVLACELQPSRSVALRAEYALKQLKRAQKLEWIAQRSESG